MAGPVKTLALGCTALAAALLSTACGGGETQPPAESRTRGERDRCALPSPPLRRRRRIPRSRIRLQYRDPGGMWMPSQMTLPQHTDVFSKMGVKLDPKKLADPLESPLAAVVFLGGCTGSFVSPDGLVVTNHHCVQGALQLNSKDGKNYVEDGFLAKTRADEPTAGPGAEGDGRAEVHRRDGADARRPRQDQGPGRAQAREREAAEAAHRGVREGPPGHPLPGVVLLPGRPLPAHRDARDPRRAPRLRAGALGRRLRRRDRQLGVAAPHGRLVVLSARTSARTASPPTTRPTTCPTSRSTGCRCRPTASSPATS